MSKPVSVFYRLSKGDMLDKHPRRRLKDHKRNVSYMITMGAKLLADISVTVAQLHSTHKLQKYVDSSTNAPTLRTEFLLKNATTLLSVNVQIRDVG